MTDREHDHDDARSQQRCDECSEPAALLYGSIHTNPDGSGRGVCARCFRAERDELHGAAADRLAELAGDWTGGGAR